jgi:hypothetical protein
VGVLLHPKVLSVKPGSGGHLTAYLRRFAPDGLLGVLGACGLPVRVYGLGQRPPLAGATFHEVSADGFLEDLATCEALVCTAGNQLVGEALYLGKPVLALPEPGNWEQRINAHFLRQEGAGEWEEMGGLGRAEARRFLDRLDAFRSRIRPESVRGNESALHALQPYLA